VVGWDEARNDLITETVARAATSSGFFDHERTVFIEVRLVLLHFLECVLGIVERILLLLVRQGGDSCAATTSSRCSSLSTSDVLFGSLSTPPRQPETSTSTTNAKHSRTLATGHSYIVILPSFVLLSRLSRGTVTRATARCVPMRSPQESWLRKRHSGPPGAHERSRALRTRARRHTQREVRWGTAPSATPSDEANVASGERQHSPGLVFQHPTGVERQRRGSIPPQTRMRPTCRIAPGIRN
jgi:hypothetical protein